MPDPSPLVRADRRRPPSRSRVVAVTVVACSMLAGTAVSGVILELSAGRSDLRSASATPTASRTAAGTGVPAAALPLRVPAPTVTMTGHPVPAPKPRPPSLPTANERDHDLAAWLASASDVDPGPEGATVAQPQLVLPSADAASGIDSATGGDLAPTVGGVVGADAAGTTLEGPDASPSTGGTDTSGASAQFGLSSFNVLGNSHTLHGARGRASGVSRINGVAALLARHDVDVVGFQELQAVQARALLRVTHGSYALWPGAGRGRDSDNSIGWRTSEWQLVRTSTLPIPYFNGHRRAMPVILLRNRASGISAWFGNFHNPAETSRFHHQQRWRSAATALEAAMANRIVPTGVPLFVTGDMNERAPYFCRLTAAAPAMLAARGGSNGAGGCAAGRPRAVDWIFGSRGVSFNGYDEDRTHLVDVTTDHPVISARVTISAATFPRSRG